MCFPHGAFIHQVEVIVDIVDFAEGCVSQDRVVVFREVNVNFLFIEFQFCYNCITVLGMNALQLQKWVTMVGLQIFRFHTSSVVCVEDIHVLYFELRDISIMYDSLILYYIEQLQV